MNDHSTRAASELDEVDALAGDPFLLGLDAERSAPANDVSSVQERERLAAAARAMLQQIQSQPGQTTDGPVAPAFAGIKEPAPPPELELDPLPGIDVGGDRIAQPSWSSVSARDDDHVPEPWRDDSGTHGEDVAGVIPDGAFLAADGRPFRDVDAALFKSRRLAAEAGEPFEVIAVAGGFVVVPEFEQSPALLPSTPASLPPRAAHSPKQPKSAAVPSDTKEIDSLTLDQLPEGHPARKYGLPLYKSVLAQTRKPLRQAWRSQLPLLIVAAVGLLVFLFPGALVQLTAQPGSAGKLASPTFTKGIGLAGLALCAFVLGKVLWIRITHRYHLGSNYVKAESGLVARRSTKLVYGTILATDAHQSVLGRLLNFGTVELSCAGADGNEILIENVYAPEIVQAVIEARIMAMRSGSS